MSRPRPAKGYLRVLGRRIRAARLMAGLTMFQCSELLGFSQWTQLQRYEAGRAEIRASDLWRLGQITGCGMPWFYD